jgi:hypothetical protein
MGIKVTTQLQENCNPPHISSYLSSSLTSKPKAMTAHTPTTHSTAKMDLSATSMDIDMEIEDMSNTYGLPEVSRGIGYPEDPDHSAPVSAITPHGTCDPITPEAATPGTAISGTAAPGTAAAGTAPPGIATHGLVAHGLAAYDPGALVPASQEFTASRPATPAPATLSLRAPPQPSPGLGGSNRPGSKTGEKAQRHSFQLVASSFRLKNLVPIKILCLQADGTYIRQGYTFDAQVLLHPIAGPYGNFRGSEGSAKYVRSRFKYDFPFYHMLKDATSPFFIDFSVVPLGPALSLMQDAV